MNKFVQQAQKILGKSAITAGREKLETEDIVGKKLHINAIDFLPKRDENGDPIADDNGEIEEYVVVAVDDGYYYCGGTVLTGLCKGWMENYDSVEALNKDLTSEGGVDIIINKRTGRKSGNGYYDVTAM